MQSQTFLGLFQDLPCWFLFTWTLIHFCNDFFCNDTKDIKNYTQRKLVNRKSPMILSLLFLSVFLVLSAVFAYLYFWLLWCSRISMTAHLEIMIIMNKMYPNQSNTELSRLNQGLDGTKASLSSGAPWFWDYFSSVVR